MIKLYEAKEVTENENAEIISDISKDKVMEKEASEKTYVYRTHVCYHDEGKPCTASEWGDEF